MSSYDFTYIIPDNFSRRTFHTYNRKIVNLQLHLLDVRMSMKMLD